MSNLLPLPPTLPASLRSMTLADLPAVLAIERQCQQYPWSEANFRSSINSSHQAYVLESTSTGVIAFVIVSTVVDEAELLNIAVAPHLQGRGLGRLLIDGVCHSFESSIQTLFLEVRSSNHRAIEFYQAASFNEVGLRPNYYPAVSGREDAVIMAKILAETL